MIYFNCPNDYDGYKCFEDRSTTMALRREKYDNWLRQKERVAWLKQVSEIKARNEEKIKAGQPESNMEPLPPAPQEPVDPRKNFVWDADSCVGLIDRDNSFTQTTTQIFGKMFDTTFSNTLGSKKFEKNMGHLFPKLEVMKLTRSEPCKQMNGLVKNMHKEFLAKTSNAVNRNPDGFKKTISVNETIFNMTIDEWIVCVISLFKSIPPLVTLLDLDIKRVAFNSGRYNAKHCSTISQVDTILRLMHQKEMLLNMYVLNKYFAGITLNSQERMVFICVLQKSMPTDKITSQKLRTAYRTRRILIRRFREFCMRRGYDANWFREHFSEIPCVRYYVEKIKEKEDKRLKELEMDKHEYKNIGVDPLAFLSGEKNIEGEPVYHANPKLKLLLEKSNRQSRNAWAAANGVKDLVIKNEARSFAYRLGSAQEFDRLMDELPPSQRKKVEAQIGARHSASVLKDYMKEVKDYESGEEPEAL